MSQQNQAQIAKLLRLVFLFTPVLFAGVGVFLALDTAAASTELPAFLIPILLGAAMAALAAAVMANRQMERMPPATEGALPPLFVVSLALSESAVIFGFVLTFLKRDPTFVVGCAVASIAVQLLLLKTPNFAKNR